MEKSINFWLLAALACGLSLSVASCKDDDDGLSKEEQQQELLARQHEQALKFWSVAGQLVSMNDATDDYASKTFEPTIGTEGSEPQTRIVYTNNAAAAAENFAFLVDAADVTEHTVEREWSDPDVGALTYRKVTDGTAWATVDVNIRQVPHLSKIIYRSPSQSDLNDCVKDGGRAYYRFGDVVSKQNDNGHTEYWICVSPAFGPEGKRDPYWASVSLLPKKNQWSWTYNNTSKKISRTYVLPDALGVNKVQMQNLAEMLYAVYNPQEWYDNVENYGSDGLSIFHDFNAKNVMYHNQLFWQNVQNGWRTKDLVKTMFGISEEQMKADITGKGLYLLYKGYLWSAKFGSVGGPKFYQAHYFNTPGGKNANMQTASPFQEVSHNVFDKNNPSRDIEFNIATECTATKPYVEKSAFFGDSNYRYIVRIASAKELSSTSKYDDNQKPISGVQEHYRYYRDVNPCDDLQQEPEVTE